MEEQKKNPAQGLSESEQVQVRRQKLADLQAAGHDPFTLTKYPQDAYSADLKAEFAALPNETDSGKTVALAGRMMSKRVMGKASFAHLRDDKGDIQLYVRRDELGEEPYAAFKKLDVGDIIGVKGEVFRTKTGELSVRATELTLLAKSDMASFVDSLVAPLSLINALIVAIGRKKNDDLSQTFETLEQIWDEYEVYEKVEEIT